MLMVENYLHPGTKKGVKMPDLLEEKRFIRLMESVEWAEKQLDFQRRKRVEAIRLLVGSHFGEGGARQAVPVNNLKMAVDIYVRSLAPHSPRIMATTIREEMRATAVSLELAVNEIPKEIGLDDTLRKWVTEAMFSIGVLKVGLHSVGQALGQEYGESFADVITLDDYFLDMSAKTMETIQYEGNSYWMKVEDLKKMKSWTHYKNISGVVHDEFTVVNEQGQERAEGVTTNETAEVFSERKWLRDVYLPDEGIMITYSVKDKVKYNEVEWDGPDDGPYLKLGFADVPGNLLPLPPVSMWRDLHELGNNLFRKLGRQADSEKSVLGFPGGDEEAVTEFKGARDGDGIAYNAGEPKRLVAGGVNQKTLAFYLQTRDLFSYFAGNLDSLGGLAALSETATQDKLMSNAASAQLKDMSVRTVAALRKLFEALAYYEWNDPIKSRTLQKSIPGSMFKIPVKWNAESRKGKISDFFIDIDVYSLLDDSPSAKLQKVSLIVKEYVLPLMPLIQAAGGTVDVQRLLQIVSRYSDTPEISEIVIFSDRPMDAPASGQRASGQAPKQAPQARPSGGGVSRKGASNAIQQALLSSAQGDGSDD